MSDRMPDDLWRDFPKTAPAFEARFKTEEDCRAYWIKVRWGGKPACAKCKCERVRVRSTPVQEERQVVSWREPVQEEHPTIQDKCRRPVGACEHEALG